MRQASDDLDLAEEPGGPDRGGQLRVQHLYRDLAFVFQVYSQKHRRHAAAPELTFDLVASGDTAPQALDDGRHSKQKLPVRQITWHKLGGVDGPHQRSLRPAGTLAGDSSQSGLFLNQFPLSVKRTRGKSRPGNWRH